MTNALTKLQDVCTIRRAAKLIGMKRDRLFEICKNAQILIPWGGTPKHPRFKVRLSEAENAILSLKQAKDQKPSKKLHRWVEC